MSALEWLVLGGFAALLIAIVDLRNVVSRMNNRMMDNAETERQLLSSINGRVGEIAIRAQRDYILHAIRFESGVIQNIRAILREHNALKKGSENSE